MGNDASLRLSIPVIFHNQRGVVQHILLSLIFLFKRVWAAYKWDIDLFLQWLQFVEACQTRATKVCQTEPWNQNNDTLNQPVLFYSLPFSKFLFFSQDVFLTHANLEAFPKTTALAESPVWDVHLAFFLIWTLEIFLKKNFQLHWILLNDLYPISIWDVIIDNH